MAVEDDLVRIAASGDVSAVGSRAARRLQARAGAFELLPSPAHYVVMRQVLEGDEARSCILSGEIQSAGILCDVLSFVAHTGRRGELLVQDLDDGVSRSVFFEDGSVVAAQSNAVNERLGEVLYRYGVLSREQVNACADASANGAIRFGEAAVKLGILSRESVFSHMGRQTEEIAYGMLLASRGVFYFLDGFDDSQLSWRQPLSTSTLIREGIRRMHETKYFRARIPSEHHIPVRLPKHPPPAVDPMGVYAAIDGERSMSDLGRIVRAGEFEVTRAVFQLIQTGHVAVTKPRLARASIIATYNRAIGLILRELDATDQGDAVREQLAAFAAQRGMNDLFGPAGPSDDGTIDPARLAPSADNAHAASNDALADRLYEYASYALFLARPHLRRRDEGRSRDPKNRLSLRVSELLDPIAPSSKKEPGTGGAPAAK